MRFIGQQSVAALFIILMAFGGTMMRCITHAHSHSSEAGAHWAAARSHTHPPGGLMHGHAHAHRSHTRHNEATNAAEQGSNAGQPGLFSHTHLLWLGMDIVLPRSPGPGEEPTNELVDCSIDLYLSRTLGAADAQTESSGSDAWLPITALCRTELPGRPALRRAFSMARFATPLCDAARLARTGVFQL